MKGSNVALNCKDLTGLRFNNLTVIKRSENYISPSGDTKSRWECKCDCGKLVKVIGTRLATNKTKSCGCLHTQLLVKRNKAMGMEKAGNPFLKRRRGTNNISGRFMCQLKYSAKKREIVYDITIDYLQKVLEMQKFKCALTGIDLIMDANNTFSLVGTESVNTGSLDRIDSSKGYVEGNVQWVHKTINLMKLSHTNEKFIDWCNEVSKYNSRASEELLIGLLP
jgi:hypothetical protein